MLDVQATPEGVRLQAERRLQHVRYGPRGPGLGVAGDRVAHRLARIAAIIPREGLGQTEVRERGGRFLYGREDLACLPVEAIAVHARHDEGVVVWPDAPY